MMFVIGPFLFPLPDSSVIAVWNACIRQMIAKYVVYISCTNITMITVLELISTAQRRRFFYWFDVGDIAAAAAIAGMSMNDFPVRTALLLHGTSETVRWNSALTKGERAPINNQPNNTANKWTTNSTHNKQPQRVRSLAHHMTHSSSTSKSVHSFAERI